MWQQMLPILPQTALACVHNKDDDA